ncbi:MAG: riboflavin synthase [bacterium]
MFTGIIERVGTVLRVSSAGGSPGLLVDAGALADGLKPGDSLCVSGVCLTVASFRGGAVWMDVGGETRRRTTLKNLAPGDRVNLETSLTMSRPLGGHFVTGHVDGVGRVAEIRHERNQRVLKIEFPPDLDPFIAPRGSVAVDGVSLTVGGVAGSAFEAYIIPHTWENTTIRGMKPGGAVNIEADVIARYVHRALGGAPAKGGGLEELLKGWGGAVRGT